MRLRLLPALLPLLSLAACFGGRYSADLTLVSGTYEHDVSGTGGLDDETDATAVRLRGEGFGPDGFGGGALLDVLGSENDLFGADGMYARADLFLYGGYEYRPSADFRVPLRAGLLFSGSSLELGDAADTIQAWGSAGIGVEASPEVRLLGTPEEFALSAFGDLLVGLMGTEVELDTVLGTETFDTTAATATLHLGLRGEAGVLVFSLGLFSTAFVVNESEEKSGIRLRPTKDTFGGVAFGLGVRF